ncbi:hypothetical protein FRC02_002609 [Tulasnella sp. 418]|nr:hypothetical protein FRC02_002609 [Tulasnella sp. 418]
MKSRNPLSSGVQSNNLREGNRNFNRQEFQTPRQPINTRSSPSHGRSQKRPRSSPPQQTFPKRPRRDSSPVSLNHQDESVIGSSSRESSNEIEEIPQIQVPDRKGKGRATDVPLAELFTTTSSARKANGHSSHQAPASDFLFPQKQQKEHIRWSESDKKTVVMHSVLVPPLNARDRQNSEQDAAQSDSSDNMDLIRQQHESGKEVDRYLAGDPTHLRKGVADPSPAKQKGRMTQLMQNMARKQPSPRHTRTSSTRMGTSSATAIAVDDPPEIGAEPEDDPIEDSDWTADRMEKPQRLPTNSGTKQGPVKDTGVIPNGTVQKQSLALETRMGTNVTATSTFYSENEQSGPTSRPASKAKKKDMMQRRSGIKSDGLDAGITKPRKRFQDAAPQDDGTNCTLYNGKILPLLLWCNGSRCYTSQGDLTSVDAILGRPPSSGVPSYWIYWDSASFSVVTEEFRRQRPSGIRNGSPPAVLIVHPSEITGLQYSKRSGEDMVVFLQWKPSRKWDSGDEFDPAKNQLLFKFNPNHAEWSEAQYDRLLKHIQTQSGQGYTVPAMQLLQMYAQDVKAAQQEALKKKKPVTTATASTVQSNPSSPRVSETKIDEAPQVDPNSDEEIVSEKGLRRSTRKKNPTPVANSAAVSDTELILIYPPLHISKGDLARLEPDEFLNDTLIEFGLKHWMNRLQATNPALADQIWVFNSFFYKKLSDKGNGYNSVKKWTAKVDIFQKKYIIVPINEQFHWYLAIIYEPEHTLLPPIPQAASQRRKTRASTRVARNPTPERSTPDHAITQAPPSASESTTDQDERDQVLQLLGGDNVSMATADDTHIQEFPAGVKSRALEQDEDGDIKLFSTPASPQIDPPSRPFSPNHLNGAVQKMHLNQGIEPNDNDESSDLEYPTAEEIDELDGDDTKILPNDTGTTSPQQVDVSDHNPQGLEDTSLPADNKADEIDQQDSETEQPSSLNAETQKTAIYILDSLNLPHSPAIRNLKNWLKSEAEDKKGFDKTGLREAAGSNCQALYQPNSVDCGVYLLHFAETFIKDPPKFVEAFNTKSLKEHAKRAIFWEKDQLDTKREDLKNLILQLSQDWKARTEDQRPDSSASLARVNTAQEQVNKEIERKTASHRPPTVLSSRPTENAQSSKVENQTNGSIRPDVENAVKTNVASDSDDDIEMISIVQPKKAESRATGRRAKKDDSDGPKVGTANRLR